LFTFHCIKVYSFMFVAIIVGMYTAMKYVDWDNVPALSKTRTRQVVQGSSLTDIQIYSSRNARPSLSLSAVETEWDPALGFQIHVKPKGILFTQGQEEIHYDAESGLIYENIPQEILLKDNVQLKTDKSTIFSDEMQYKFDDHFFISKGNVKSKYLPAGRRETVTVRSQNLKYWHIDHKAKYWGNVRGEINKNRRYEGNIRFKSKVMDVDLDKSYVTLKDDVYLKKQSLIATSLRGEIFLDNYNKKLKYYKLSDDVKVRETIKLRNGGEVQRRAFAEQLEGFTLTDKVVLTGSPKVIQGNEIIKGNQITLTQENEVIEVDDSNSKFIINREKR
jgi:lipopolysaccharide transport protein LptA